MRYKSFQGWGDVLAFVSLHGFIWYQAPLDAQPVRVIAQRRGQGRKVRLVSDHTAADPFWADEGHLSRMCYRVADSRAVPELRGE